MDKGQILRHLQSLIGRAFAFRGEDYVLIDVLADEASVVLDRRGRRRATIQADQFGRPLRRTSGFHVMAVFNMQEGGVSTELNELLGALRPC